MEPNSQPPTLSLDRQLCLLELACERKLLAEDTWRFLLHDFNPEEDASLLESAASRGLLSDETRLDLSLELETRQYSTYIDGYRIEGILGTGAIGVVFQAHQLSMNRPIALKVLYPFLSRNDEFVSRFLRECHAAGQFNHPNIVQGFDAGSCRSLYYISMEYVEGSNLRKKVRQRGPFPEEEAIAIILQIARGLSHAHHQGFIHRDVKPANILVSEEGEVKLADLGLMKTIPDRLLPRHEDTALTQQGSIMGTPSYMSPEQARGSSLIDARTDIYSLGITLYYLLAGHPPFTGKNAHEILHQQIASPLPPRTQDCSSIKPSTYDVLQIMCAKDASDRYATASTLAQDLQYLLDKKLPLASSAPETVRIPKSNSTTGIPEFEYSYIPSNLEIVFAQIALKSKLVTHNQIQSCLDTQENQIRLGSSVSLPEMLIQKGYTTEGHCNLVLQTAQQHLTEQVIKEYARTVATISGIDEAEILKFLQRPQSPKDERPSISSLRQSLANHPSLRNDQLQEIDTSYEKERIRLHDQRYCKLLTDLNWIPREALQKGIEIQGKEVAKHRTRSISKILIEERYLNRNASEALQRALARFEMTGENPQQLVDEQKIEADNATSSPTSEIELEIDSSEFQLEGIEECPFCEHPTRPEATRCDTCGKALG
ncbi:MAG: serine/threonine-protein kinase [Planctomycetota bacterium]|nr:serine/threonine-protein kinase [Planctomycetota bacterium]